MRIWRAIDTCPIQSPYRIPARPRCLRRENPASPLYNGSAPPPLSNIGPSLGALLPPHLHPSYLVGNYSRNRPSPTIFSMLRNCPPDSHPQTWGNGEGTEGVWRGSHVDCTTSWNCDTYNGNFLASKCNSLTTSLPLFFWPTRLPMAMPWCGTEARSSRCTEPWQERRCWQPVARDGL